MIIAEGIAVTDAAERKQRKGAQPFVNVHDLPRPEFEGRAAREAESLGEGYQPAVIIGLAVVLQDEVITVELLVVPQVRNVHTHDIIRAGELVAELVGGQGVVGQLELPFDALTAVGVGGLDEFVFVAGRQDGRAGMAAERGDDAAQVRLGAGNIARAEQHVADDNLLLFVGGRIARAGTVDDHDRVDASEEVVGLELKVKAHPCVAVAPALAAFEAHPHVVVGTLLVIDDCARQVLVAHHVGEGVKQGTVGGRENDPHVVGEGKVGLAVRHHVERAGSGARGRIGRGRAQAVRGPDIELNNRPRRVAGDSSGIETAALEGHTGVNESAAVGGPPDLAGTYPVRVLCRHGNRDRFSGLRDDRAMLKSAEGRPQIGRIARVSRAGRPIERGNRQRCGLRHPVEVEPGVEQVVSCQPFGAKGNLVGLAINNAPSVGNGRLDVVVHVLLRPVGDDVQDMICRIVRVEFQTAEPVVAQQPPATQTRLEIAVGNQFDGAVGWRLHDTDVVDQAFAVAQKAQDKVLPLFRSNPGLGDGAVAVGSARRSVRFRRSPPRPRLSNCRRWGHAVPGSSRRPPRRPAIVHHQSSERGWPGFQPRRRAPKCHCYGRGSSRNRREW